MRSFPVVVAVVVLAVLGALGYAGLKPGAVGAPSPEALEAKLLAPCCFGGTIDVHDSPIAHELRDEIHRRFADGEPAAGIEADLVQRYGGQIEAMPNVGAFTRAVLLALGLIVVVAGALAVRVWRWRENARSDEANGHRVLAGAPPPVVTRDEYDDRLDAELLDQE